MHKINPYRARGGQFALYLQTLPPDERRRIETEEMRFLSKREMPFSRQRRAMKDFDSVMVGISEEA